MAFKLKLNVGALKYTNIGSFEYFGRSHGLTNFFTKIISSLGRANVDGVFVQLSTLFENLFLLKVYSLLNSIKLLKLAKKKTRI